MCFNRSFLDLYSRSLFLNANWTSLETTRHCNVNYLSSDQKGRTIMSYTLKGLGRLRADAYPKLRIGHDRAKNVAIENSDIFWISQSNNLYTRPWCTNRAELHTDREKMLISMEMRKLANQMAGIWLQSE